jgi:hypothetical protein
MNYKYLKGILPYFIVLLTALSLIACGSGSGGSNSGSADAGTETEPITSEDICNSDTEQKDIILLQASSIKIHWDDDDKCDLHYGFNSHYYDDDCKNDNDCYGNDRDHDCDDYDYDDCDHDKKIDMVRVKIKGELALKCTDYTQIEPIITAGISISSQELINESMEFQVRDNGSMWEYKNNAVYTGIKQFKIDWKGPGFEYDGDINIKATSIANDKTIIKIDPKNITTAFAVDIGAATIEVDDNGLVNAYPDSYASLTGINDDGTITVELLFELSKDMSIFIYQGNETSEINVARYYQASRGEFKIKGYFDPARLEGIMQSADFDFRIIIGDIELTGSANIADSEWDKSDRTWRYPSLD